MLTHQDKLILYALTINCRFPYSTISKIANLKPQTVKSRIEWMEKEGIIDKYYMTVYKIGVGIIKYTDFFYAGNFTKEQIAKIKQIPEAITITSFHGRWNLRVSINAQDMIRKNEIMDEIREILGSNMVDFAEYELRDSKYLRRLFFLEEEQEPISHLNPKGAFQDVIMEYKKTFPKGIVEFDDLDLKIMEELRLNANISLNELSEKVGANRETVVSRIKRFISTGVVGYFTVNLDYKKMGYNQFLLFIDTNDKDKALNFIKMNRYAHTHFEHSCKWNLCINFFYQNHEDMTKFITEFNTYMGNELRQTMLLEAIEEHKFTSFPSDLSKIYKNASIRVSPLVR